MKKIKKERSKSVRPLKESFLGISKTQAKINILEWLYTNDGGYSNKLDWRKKFLEVIDFNIKAIKDVK